MIFRKFSREVYAFGFVIEELVIREEIIRELVIMVFFPNQLGLNKDIKIILNEQIKGCGVARLRGHEVTRLRSLWHSFRVADCVRNSRSGHRKAMSLRL